MLTLLLSVVVLAGPSKLTDAGPAQDARPPRFRTRVTVGPAKVDGGAVDEGALSRYVRARSLALNACYQKQLEVRPELQGAVKATFEVTPLGRPTNIQVVAPEEVGGPALQLCLTRVVTGWILPFKPLAAVQLELNLHFEREN